MDLAFVTLLTSWCIRVSISNSLSFFLFLYFYFSLSLFTFLKSLTPCFTLQCLKSKAMEMTYSSNYIFLTCLLHINFHPVVGYTTKNNDDR